MSTTRLLDIIFKEAIRVPGIASNGPDRKDFIQTARQPGQPTWEISIDWEHRVVRVATAHSEFFTPLENVKDYRILPPTEEEKKEEADWKAVAMRGRTK